MSDQLTYEAGGSERALRWTTVAFVIALAVHGADHLRRGMNIIPFAVMLAGNIQLVFAAITVVLVFRSSRAASSFAVAVGSISAIGFTAAHLLPSWGLFSDSFINAPPAARVTWFSWVSAIVEILADIALALVGFVVLRARRHSKTLHIAAAPQFRTS